MFFHSLQQSVTFICIFLLETNSFFFSLSPVKFVECRFRITCHRIIDQPHFSNFILFCILSSSVLLAIEKPKEDPHEVSFFYILILYKNSYLFFLFFAVLKIFGYIFRHDIHHRTGVKINNLRRCTSQRSILSVVLQFVGHSCDFCVASVILS